MASKRSPQDYATLDELADAIGRLSGDELRRLWRQGNVLALGSAFAGGKELLNEAVKRALIGASGEPQEGERGRPWPRTVDLVAFLMECMRSIANGSQNSVKQKADRRAEALAMDDGEANPELADADAFSPGVDDALIDRQEQERRQAVAEAEVAAIRALFPAGDPVHDILDGEAMGMTAEDIRQAAGLDATAYASARKKLRRTVGKHIPGRRAP